MGTFHLMNGSLSVFMRLLVCTLIWNDLWTSARKININLFDDECSDYTMGADDVVNIHHRDSVKDLFNCEFNLRAPTNRYLQYYINDANIIMCGVTLKIMDGSQMWKNPINFDCKKKIMLPLFGRTRANRLAFRIKNTRYHDADFTFNMTVVTNIVPPRLINWTEPLEKEYDICNPPDALIHNPATIYLPKPGYSTQLNVELESSTAVLPKCVFVVKTCPQCQVRVEVAQAFDFSRCRLSSGCPLFTFYDGDYKDQTLLSISDSNGLGKSYDSESRHLFIETIRSLGASFKNFKDHTGPHARFRVSSHLKYNFVSRINPGASFELTSPFFPDHCIQNGETYKVLIQNLWDDYFLITFDDWQMPGDARVEISGTTFNIKGSQRRRYFYSSRNREELTFYTGSSNTPWPHRVYAGFRATVSFNNGSVSLPKTDCDKVLEGSVGLFGRHFNSIVTDVGPQDCIWLVKKPVNAQGVQLSTTHLECKDPWFSLEVREGLFSTAPLKHLSNSSANGSVLLSTSGEGFYIRFRGSLRAKDNLGFLYTAFSYGCDPFGKDMFLCLNKRCIDMVLRCDGVDHCGDNSDEGERACSMSDNEDDDDSDSDMAVVIPVVVTLVVVIIVVIFVVLLVRCFRRRPQRSPETVRIEWPRAPPPPPQSQPPPPPQSQPPQLPPTTMADPPTVSSHLVTPEDDENDPISIKFSDANSSLNQNDR